MVSFDEEREGLEHFLIAHVPLARAAGLQVDAYTGDRLVTSAPLDKNINDKATAFGGSLYIACVSAGWGMTYLKTRELELEGDLVIAKAEVEYLSPLRDRLVATASAPSEAELEKFQRRYQARGKAALSIEVTMQNELGRPCVRFHGKYAIVRPISSPPL